MIDINSFLEEDCPTIEESVRYLKTLYNSNRDRYQARFLEPSRVWLSMNEVKNGEKIIDFYDKLFDNYKQYSYSEALSIKNSLFRGKVFSAIDVPQMIANLGSTRIAVEGVELENNLYDTIKGEFTKHKFTQIYELHKVNGEGLELTEDIYAIKCWCTSTEEEHWLWTTEEKDPLEAIANCCIVYKKMVGNIKHIIRQGDVFLFEMKNEIDISEDDETIPLSKDIYFSLLKAQS